MTLLPHQDFCHLDTDLESAKDDQTETARLMGNGHATCVSAQETGRREQQKGSKSRGKHSGVLEVSVISNNCDKMMSGECKEVSFILNIGPNPASFCLVSSFSQRNDKYCTKFGNELKKCRWNAKDSNLGSDDGRYRRIH